MNDWMWINRGNVLLAVTIITFILAFMRGGGPERCVAATLLGMGLSDRIYHFFHSGGSSVWTISQYHEVDLGHVTIDGFAMLVLGLIGIKANRIYPIWIGGFQIIAVLSHFSRILSTEAHPVAYAIMERIPFYLQIIVLTLGLASYHFRGRQQENIQPWRRSWNHSLPHQPSKLRIICMKALGPFLRP